MVIRTDASMPVPDAAGEPSSPESDAARREIVRARALVDQLHEAGRQSTAELLQELRRAFPHSPLAFRVRALEALRRR